MASLQDGEAGLADLHPPFCSHLCYFDCPLLRGAPGSFPLKELCPGLSRWNQLDLAIVLLSIMGITLEEIEVNASLPINPTIIRIMRVLRIARGRCPPSCPSRAYPGGDSRGRLCGRPGTLYVCVCVPMGLSPSL